MPAYKSLVKGEKYRMIVDELTDNVSNFKGREAQMYCHSLSLRDENGYIYPAQLCTKTVANGLCNAGELIEFEISAYTKEIYSLQKVSRVAQVKFHGIELKEEKLKAGIVEKIQNTPPEYQKNTSGPFTGSIINPSISGTAAQSAMHEAVYFLCHQPNIPFDNAPETDDVLALADKIYSWYESKLNIHNS